MVRSKYSGLRSGLASLALCFASMISLEAQGQTPEQLEIFRNLPPEQQQAILQTLGGSDGSGAATVQDRGPRLQEARDARARATDARSDSVIGGESRFKPRDSLLLSLKIREFANEESLPATGTPPSPQTQPPAPASTTSQGLRVPILRTEAETTRLEELRTRILRRNPFSLDKWGILNIPELGPIPLQGLTAEEARLRIAAEPLLSDYIVQVTYLPVEPVGTQALRPFGHELFKGPPDTFAPATDIPVPAEYVVGPGDRFEIQLIGSSRGRYSLVVQRDGRINFPELGPIAVSGMRFDEARSLLEQRVSEQLIGTTASIQMGEVRSIQIYVVGEAERPGAYTVSGLSTITNALFVSGGVKEIGSLRNIELKRNGQTVSRFDLYDLLLRGDTRADTRLISGDVILIPPANRIVGAAGEVRRPALYELKNERTVADLVQLAGGLGTEADARKATVERIDVTRKRIVLDTDLTGAGAGLSLIDGDVLHVPSIRSTLDDAIILRGHVHRPGEYQHRQGLRISDVIPSLEELKPMADQHYVLIRREIPPTRKIEVLSVDLVQALERRGSEADPVLAPRDQIFVFDLETGRDRLLQPIMRELRLQSTQPQRSGLRR
jgi:polysaccharide export outer membrane protein